MRYLLPVLLLASLGLAQIFGPAGVPLTWDFGIVSFESDSIFSDYFSSTGATSFIYFAGDTLYMESSTVSDGDFRIAFVEQDGTEHKQGFDDSADWYDWDNDGYMVGTMRATTGLISDVDIQAGGGNNVTIRKTGEIQTEGTVTTLCLDANDAGQGTVCAGVTGDNDRFSMNSQLYYAPKTIADGDATPSVAGGNIFTTSANTAATEITDLDNPIAGQTVTIIGGSNTNSSTIADSGNFNLSGAWTASLDDVLILYVQADNDYIEIGRVDN